MFFCNQLFLTFHQSKGKSNDLKIIFLKIILKFEIVELDLDFSIAIPLSDRSLTNISIQREISNNLRTVIEQFSTLPLSYLLETFT